MLVIQTIENDQRPPDLSYLTPLCTALLLTLITLASAGFRLFEELQTERLLQRLQQPPTTVSASGPQSQSTAPAGDFESDPLCVVVREAQRITVPISELVAGDLLELRSGERLPADVRLVKSATLKVDCAELTGDSSFQSRTADYSADSAFEAKNLCFAGSLCTEGEGTGVVIATGPRTVAARLQALASNQPERQTPAISHLRKFISTSLCIPLNGSLVLFPLAMALGFTWFETCILLLGLVLAILPQSLLCIADACFQLAVRRIAARLCLVREPAALEALAHCDLMLLDKTGTLTQNRLTVVHFWFDGRLEAAQLTEEQTGAHRLTRKAEFLPLELAATLCNSAKFASGQTSLPVQKRRVLHGNQVESALLKCMELIHDQSESMRSQHPRRLQLPFSSVSKVHVVIHELNLSLLLRQRPQLDAFYPSDHGAGPNLLMIKGAPEKILDRCSSWIHNGRERVLTGKDRQVLNQAFSEMCRRAERVVAFADLWLSGARFPAGFEFDSSTLNFPLVGLRFLGFVSMYDPPRPDVSECVQQLHRSGLRLVMVTGDHAITAKALARSVGLVDAESETVEEIALRTATPVQQVDRSAARLVVLSGSQLHEVTNDQLDQLMSTIVGGQRSAEMIFARLEPAQKLRVVESAQRVGLVVAGVGDGLNDLPMLRRCDVSTCIGTNEIVQRHSQLLILDGSFASVLHALRQARACSLSLRRAIAFSFCANAPQTAAFLVCLLFGLPLPLSVGALVLIDLAVDVLPALGLCYEPVDRKSSIKQSIWSPRLIDSSLLSFAWLQIGAVQAAAGLFAYFVLMAQNGFWMSDLFFLRQQWDSMAINDLKDSVGQEWVSCTQMRFSFSSIGIRDFPLHSGLRAAKKTRVHLPDRLLFHCGCLPVGDCRCLQNTHAIRFHRQDDVSVDCWLSIAV